MRRSVVFSLGFLLLLITPLSAQEKQALAVLDFEALGIAEAEANRR